MRRRSITVAIFPTISPPSHVFSLCKCARKDKGGERESAPITCLSQDDSSGCGKALYPSIRPLAFTFPHPISACHLFPSEGKNRTAGRGNYRTARRSGGESILSLLSPKKHFLGSPVVAQSLSPPPSPRPVRSRRWMGRCDRRVLCTRAPVWCSTFDDSSSTPYLSPIASPSSNAISKRLTKYITIVQSASYQDQTTYISRRRDHKK